MKDTDLNTLEDRIAWFCEHFEVSPPKIEYDEDEPGAVLLTDELLKWCRVEGISIDWLFAGGVGSMAAVFRDKYKIDPEVREAVDLISQLSEEEQGIILDALKSEAPFEDALQMAHKQIEALRAA
ncbi:hypothetical protein [Roseovarius amoyensis]|uniref:hypothetical protein n=1 Tax=Roseovarius amoyensis TaxID=2211448 RepID=UPI000DBEA091|nr:hypothetical protein [Roseovarius amoyensis]